MMRITGGQARGIQLSTGKSKGVRPATDRMREALFSSLGNRVQDAFFLDLFAGTGSYGLEALSRGSRGGLFVEKQASAVEALEKNVKAVGKSIVLPPANFPGIIRRDALRFETQEHFDLIFLDPPYSLARTHLDLLLGKVRAWLKEPRGMLIMEIPSDLHPSLENWTCLRRFGQSGAGKPCVFILQVKN